MLNDNNKIDIIDPSEIVASAVKLYLEKDNLMNKNNSKGTKHFYISDYTETFEENTRLFFDEEIVWIAMVIIFNLPNGF